jgi:hypothetical protein
MSLKDTQYYAGGTTIFVMVVFVRTKERSLLSYQWLHGTNQSHLAFTKFKQRCVSSNSSQL